MTLWIASNATDDATWHLAEKRELVSASGKVFSRYSVTRCSGKKLGGPYGYSVKHRHDITEYERVCSRCVALEARAENSQGVSP